MIKKEINKVSLKRWVDANESNITRGVTVRIKPGTRYEGLSGNPTNDVEGVIIGDGVSRWYSVKWDNGMSNVYNISDLIVNI